MIILVRTRYRPAGFPRVGTGFPGSGTGIPAGIAGFSQPQICEFSVMIIHYLLVDLNFDYSLEIIRLYFIEKSL